MDRKIRVGAVSYLNTKPLVFGFGNGQMPANMDLQFYYPSLVADKLINDDIDLGLIPVAAIPKLKEAYIISDFCIGANRAVASVCLFSDVPMAEIKEIYLDYQSRTSAALLQILLKSYWKISPVFLAAEEGYENKISGTRAGLVIGDRAFLLRNNKKFIYDLATAWKDFTGKSFVFAAWVANKKLPETFINAFNLATGKGLQHINEIVAAENYKEYDLHTYYTKNISYTLDEDKRAALDLFLEKILSNQQQVSFSK